ncbi:hypothetical protein TWF481_006277 [Arthrobotrys musiformis]|uniref:CFEM domain-containing protein n=1 Tax=Arthrobotrys musiformis TaxID=47236 RepID=A0AAV9WG63_9PEZI
MQLSASFSNLCWASLLWISAVAQFEEGQIPPCASTCTYGAFYNQDCQDKDYYCLCKDPTMLTFLIPCTGALCEPSEIDQTIHAVEDLCASFSVTLSISTTWSATQPSTTIFDTSRSSHPSSATKSSPKTTSVSASLTQTGPGSAMIPSDTSTATPTPETGGGSKLGAGAIAGIAIGASVPVIALIAFLYTRFQRRNRKFGSSMLPVNKYSEPSHWGGIGPDNDIPGQLITRK